MEKDAISLLSPVWNRNWVLYVERGEGPYLIDTQGRRFLDFTCGIGVTNTGHAHPRVVKAIQEQAALLLHGQANIVVHKPMLRLAEELRTVVPSPLDSYFFTNSGAEAIEGAVKLARHATHRPNVIVFQGSFHGRTNATMAMSTSKTIYRAGYQPLASGVFVAPYPYAYRYGWDEETTLRFCLRELKLLAQVPDGTGRNRGHCCRARSGRRRLCCPAGRVLASAQRPLRPLLASCWSPTRSRPGSGRTGKWFAFEHSRVVPDILVMAKGIASGLPLAGLAARRELMEHWIPGSHGGTYGGNVVACAAAVATIQVIREERLVENAARMGEVLLGGLRQLQAAHPEIGEVRGRGLMIASEFTDPSGEPWTERAKAAAKAAYEEGLLLLTCGTYDNVVRWIPPLVVNASQIEEGLEKFERALERSRGSA